MNQQASDFITSYWTEPYTSYRAVLMLESLHADYIRKDAKRKRPKHDMSDCHACWLIAHAKAFDTFKEYAKKGPSL